MSSTRSTWAWNFVDPCTNGGRNGVGPHLLRRWLALLLLLACSFGRTGWAQNPFLIPAVPVDPETAWGWKASQQFENNAQPNPPQDGPTKGDPVSLLTGELQMDETDLTIVGRGIDFTLSRSYRSRTARSSALGKRWDFNWNQFIVLQYNLQQPPGDGPGQNSGDTGELHAVAAYYYDGCNRIVPFYPDTSATEWSTPPGYFAKLRHDGVPPITDNPPTRFQLRNADGTILTFGLRDTWDPYVAGLASIYRLTRIEDRSGNALDFEYQLCSSGTNQAHRLYRILDTLSTPTNLRPITFTYYSADPYAPLISVSDFAGRTVVYEQDAHGNLTGVRTPTVTGTVTQNDYPAGKTAKYTYPTWSTGSSHNHDLLTAIAPQEYQNGAITNPVPYLQNTYDSGSHVISQAVGGTNASGIAAGGLHTFRYEAASVLISHVWFAESLRTLSIVVCSETLALTSSGA